MKSGWEMPKTSLLDCIALVEARQRFFLASLFQVCVRDSSMRKISFRCYHDLAFFIEYDCCNCYLLIFVPEKCEMLLTKYSNEQEDDAA